MVDVRAEGGEAGGQAAGAERAGKGRGDGHRQRGIEKERDELDTCSASIGSDHVHSGEVS